MDRKESSMRLVVTLERDEAIAACVEARAASGMPVTGRRFARQR